MTRRLLKITLAGASLIALGGCVGGNPLVHSQSVRIQSNPAGAMATSEYGDSCTTPCRLRLLTSRGGQIRVAREGYDPVDVFIGTRQDGLRVAMTAASAVGHVADPDPVSIAFDALHYLLDGRGHTRVLDAHRVSVDLPLASDNRPVPVQHAGVALSQPGPGVVRLTRGQVDAILGPPIAERQFPAATETAPAPR